MMGEETLRASYVKKSQDKLETVHVGSTMINPKLGVMTVVRETPQHHTG